MNVSADVRMHVFKACVRIYASMRARLNDYLFMQVRAYECMYVCPYVLCAYLRKTNQMQHMKESKPRNPKPGIQNPKTKFSRQFYKISR